MKIEYRRHEANSDEEYESAQPVVSTYLSGPNKGQIFALIPAYTPEMKIGGFENKELTVLIMTPLETMQLIADLQREIEKSQI